VRTVREGDAPRRVPLVRFLGIAAVKPTAALVAAALLAGCASTTPEDEAIAAFRDAIEAHRAKDFVRAKAAAERAEELRPGFVDPLMFLASIAVEEGDLDAARGRWTQVLAVDPTATAAGVAIGWSHMAQGRRSEAREWFEKAVASDPGFEGAVFNLGLLSRDEGNPDEAVLWFEIATVLDRSDPRGWVQIGEIRLAQGRAEEALAAAEAALRRYAISDRAQTLRARAQAAIDGQRRSGN
jgi:tetratricopeptide (TPR) repeat protein